MGSIDTDLKITHFRVINEKRKTNDDVDIYKSDCNPEGVAHSYLLVPLGNRFKRESLIQFQIKPRNEGLTNGVTLDDVVAVAIDHIEGWQATPLACEQNAKILEHLNSILDLCNERHADREARGVKGTSGV